MKRFSKITTTQLARICGVSQGTVDRALHNRDDVNAQTRERILAVAKEYDYAPKLKNGTQENSMLIGVVLFDLYNEFFSKLAMSLVREAKRAGYSVIFQFSNKDKQSEKEALEYFDYIGVDGILLFPVGDDSKEYENYLRSIKKPLVLIGNKMFHLPFIGIDDEKAMCELSTKLLKCAPIGNILYYAPVLANESLHATNAQRLRLNGFIQAMQEHNRNYQIVTRLEDISNFSAIVCSTDYYALQVLNHLRQPPNLVISGFDNISLLKSMRANLFTVDYSTDTIAKECLRYILGQPFHACIPHEIIKTCE